MKWWIVAACAAIPVAAWAAPDGQDPNASVIVGTGVGTAPCSGFNKMITLDQKWAHDNFMSWAQGFMTGSNFERDAHRAILSATSNDDQWQRLVSYCAAHPDKTFGEGVWGLYLSLPRLP